MATFIEHLAGILKEHHLTVVTNTCACGISNPSRTWHDTHLAELASAAAQDHYLRSINSPEQLDTLPAETVLIDGEKDIFVIGNYRPVNLSADGASPIESPVFPAVVTHLPESTGWPTSVWSLP